MIARLDPEVEEIALDRAEDRARRCRGEARARGVAAEGKYRDAGASHRRGTSGRQREARAARRAAQPRPPRITRARSRASSASCRSRRQLRDHGYGGRHHRHDRSRIKIDFYVPERFAANMAVRRPSRRLADRASRRGVRRHGERGRQPRPTTRAARCCAGLHPQRGRRRCAPACRSASRSSSPVTSSPPSIRWRSNAGTDGAFAWVIPRRQAQARDPRRPAQYGKRAGRCRGHPAWRYGGDGRRARSARRRRRAGRQKRSDARDHGCNAADGGYRRVTGRKA